MVIDVATLTGARGGRTRRPDSRSDGFRRRHRGEGPGCGRGGWRGLLAAADPEGHPEQAGVQGGRHALDLGDRGAGALVAAAFLREFVAEDIPWAHLDIAGPAFLDGKPYGYVSAGGTGVRRPYARSPLATGPASADRSAGTIRRHQQGPATACTQPPSARHSARCTPRHARLDGKTPAPQCGPGGQKAHCSVDVPHHTGVRSTTTSADWSTIAAADRDRISASAAAVSAGPECFLCGCCSRASAGDSRRPRRRSRESAGARRTRAPTPATAPPVGSTRRRTRPAGGWSG